MTDEIFIREGSQLIAAYLGEDNRVDQWNKSCIVRVYNTAMCKMNPKGECWIETEYHKSWDWIMPAVRKAKEYYVPFTEGHGRYKKIEDGLLNLDIDLVFIACVEFVKWYNKQT